MVLIAVGLCSTALGVLGIFLPLLPTVPLLLLAAACFVRSSERLHAWLVGHRRLGPMVRSHLDGRGMPRRAKVVAILLLWLTIPVSALFFVSFLWARILLLAVGLCITVYLMRLPVVEEEAEHLVVRAAEEGERHGE